MGLTRQAVQRIANELERDGLIRFAPNPYHERAKLVLLTEAGSRAFATAMRRQAPWAARLGRGLKPTDLETTLRVVAHLRRRLEDDPESVTRTRSVLSCVTNLAGLLALALAALFAGAAVYISLIEQPARLLLDHRALLIEWQNTYPPAMRMQGAHRHRRRPRRRCGRHGPRATGAGCSALR